MNHQRLKCYAVLLDVAKMMPRLISYMPKGSYYIEDQLKRALSSAILNLAEGNGRTSIKERARFFDISLASIAETSSAIDLIHAYGYIQFSLSSEIRAKLTVAYAMITKLKKCAQPPHVTQS